MAIPAGTPVIILPIQQRGCANFNGVVKSCCDVQECLPGTAGGFVNVDKYLVEYWFESCGQCMKVISPFCEFELQPIVPNP